MRRHGVRLGVDPGDARIGVARSDPSGILATPVETVRRGRGDLRRLRQLVAAEEAVEVVVGLPRSLSGGEGPAAVKTRDFAVRLAERIAPVPVRLVDERLTTVTAEAMLRDQRKGQQRRAVVDQVAAVVILQHALDTERATGRAPGEVVAVGAADRPGRTSRRRMSDPFVLEEDAPRQSGGRRKKRFSGCLPMLVFIAVAVLLIAAAGKYVVGPWFEDLFADPEDYPGPGTGEVMFVVDPGQTIPSMGDELEDLGVVASAEAFEDAADENGDTTGIQAGTYLLKKEMKASDVVDILVDPANLAQSTVTIPEGLRAVDIVDRIAEGTDFQEAAQAGAERHRCARAARLRGRQPRGLPVPGDLPDHPGRHCGVVAASHGRPLGAGGR